MAVIPEQVSKFPQPLHVVDQQLVREFGRGLGQFQLAAGDQCGDLRAGVPFGLLGLVGQFLVAATEPGDKTLDSGEVDDVVLDGQLLLQLLGQLVIGVADAVPFRRPPQVRSAAVRRDLLGFTGDLADVQQAVGNRADSVARLHPRQEHVQLVDQPEPLVVGQRGLVLLLHDGTELVLADALLDAFAQVPGREAYPALRQPHPLHQVESGHVGAAHQPRPVRPVPRRLEEVGERMPILRPPVGVAVGGAPDQYPAAADGELQTMSSVVSRNPGKLVDSTIRPSAMSCSRNQWDDAIRSGNDGTTSDRAGDPARIRNF